jgi:hypothetical protein
VRALLAARKPEPEGVLSRIIRTVPNIDIGVLCRDIEFPPNGFDVIDPRTTVAQTVALRNVYPLSQVTAEITATALLLEAPIAMTVLPKSFVSVCDDLGIMLHVVD